MTSIREALERARQELKRADHLIYVSLKYTRTVDVLKSIISRLIATVEAGIDALLHFAKKEGKIPAVPTLPRLKIEALKKAFAEDHQLKQYIRFYLLLRKLDKAHFERAQEYRRHVTMKAALDENHVEITIDIISDYFHKAKEFLLIIEQMTEKER
ncbi:MAG: hypothetical protein QXM31_01350 [Candidatus Woesearchaeota archaeon]